MAADQSPPSNEIFDHFPLAAPEHGFPVGQRIGEIEIKAAMNENKVIKLDIVREAFNEPSV